MHVIRTKLATTAALVAGLAALVVVAGCGGGNEKSSTPNPYPTAKDAAKQPGVHATAATGVTTSTGGATGTNAPPPKYKYGAGVKRVTKDGTLLPKPKVVDSKIATHVAVFRPVMLVAGDKKSLKILEQPLYGNGGAPKSVADTNLFTSSLVMVMVPATKEGQKLQITEIRQKGQKAFHVTAVVVKPGRGCPAFDEKSRAYIVVRTQRLFGKQFMQLFKRFQPPCK